MTTPHSDPRVVTVSRDALRADLAEMELRLRTFFDDQLKHKADRSVVQDHALLLDSFGKGEFTQAQKNAIDDIVMDTLSSREAHGWTIRERWFGVMTVVIALVSFAVSMWAASHHTPIG